MKCISCVKKEFDGRSWYELGLLSKDGVAFISSQRAYQINDDVDLDIVIGYDHKLRVAVKK